MGYTGYKIIQYIDENPNSSGYGQTWTERVLDTSNCPSGDSSWNLISSECEAVTSGYTGRRINIYYNSVTGEYSSTTESDSSCTESSSVEEWVNSGDTYCERDEDGIYTGWGIQLQVQRNSNLLNYGETREVRFSSTTCSDETNPEWETISTNCKVVSDMLTCRLYFDGTADILQIDVNPSSPTFNQTRTITGFSEDCVCEACDSVEESWRYVADYCGNQMPVEYQLSGLTNDTVYHVYRKYETCIIDGNSGRTRPTNVYSAETYQTGVSGCTYRWVDTGERDCVPLLKFKATYTGHPSTYSAECDSDMSSTILTTEITKPDGYQYTAMTSAEIGGDCITSIGDSALTYCYYLSSVTIPDSILSIGNYSFAGCFRLTNISIPSSVTSIGNYTFSGCSSLTSCTIGSGVTSIGRNAFFYCTGLTSINIPSGVTIIEESTFNNCSGLTSVTMGSSVTTIGMTAFGYCNNLKRINSYTDGVFNIPSGVTSIGALAFYICIRLKNISIPNSVTSIGSYAFKYCNSLTSITLPSGVTLIGTGAFEYCTALTSVTINATTPPVLGTDAFKYTNNCPIYVPSGSINDYKNASRWSDYSSRIMAIPNS